MLQLVNYMEGIFFFTTTCISATGFTRSVRPSQFKFHVRRRVFFMAICYGGWIRISSMRIYLNPRDDYCSRRIGNAQPRTDVLISHNTLRKQTWQRAGNLETRETRNQFLKHFLKIPEPKK